jgi:transcriptional regulator with XRE-family HTH domain
MKKSRETIAHGQELKTLRLQTGLSQDKLGDLLNITGAAWRQYELGLRIPNDKIKKRIAKHFNKTTDELFFSGEETTKWITTINGYTAKSLEWSGRFDLWIYDENNEEVFRSRTSIYSLRDASTTIRQQLGLKGKRITWGKE